MENSSKVEIMDYTFDENIFSDLYKDAYGFRPRGHEFYDAGTSDDRKQEIWDFVCEAQQASIEEDRRHEEIAIEKFKTRISEVIALGASDRATALRWMSSDETFYHDQCVEGWVYDQGILFTDYGREILTELKAVVKFVEYDS